MNNTFIILAAGSGSRYKSKIPKQFTQYKGKMMLEHSIYKAIDSKLFNRVILVINKSHKKYLSSIDKSIIKIVYGGRQRKDSSLKALKFLKKFKPKNVFIHDAARPDFSVGLLKKLNSHLIKNNSVIPFTTPSNSLKIKMKNYIRNLDRSSIYETQTPQCFRYKLIYDLSIKNKKKITDDSSLLISNGYKVKFVKGENFNKKMTYNTFKDGNILFGIGFDVHRLVKGKKLFLGGLKINSDYGTLGHSDGDPVLHSLTDSILGACGMKDIGEKFSNSNKKYKNIRSTILLKKVIDEIYFKNYRINNIDINIIAEKPKIKNYKDRMRFIISKICKIEKSRINIKGKTAEKLGIIGKELAIGCECITSVFKYD